MGAGKSELLAVYTLRQAADDHQPGGGRGNGFGEACEPDPVGASRRVPGGVCAALYGFGGTDCGANASRYPSGCPDRSEEHTSELQSRGHLVCRLLLEKKKRATTNPWSRDHL